MEACIDMVAAGMDNETTNDPPHVRHPDPAERRRRAANAKLRCSFCGLEKQNVVAGTPSPLAICSSCIRLAAEILAESGKFDSDD